MDSSYLPQSTVNFCVMTCPDETIHGRLPIEECEREGLRQGDGFVKFGTAYAIEHSTRPATIGFALSSSPLALLAWQVVTLLNLPIGIDWTAGSGRSISRGLIRPLPWMRSWLR